TRGRQDRRERRRLGVKLAQPESEESRHEQDPAADSEQSGEHARGEAEHQRQHDGRHVVSSTTPTTTSSAANASESQRWCIRCWIAVPATAPMAAGSPISAAYPHSTSPWNA